VFDISDSIGVGKIFAAVGRGTHRRGRGWKWKIYSAVQYKHFVTSIFFYRCL